MSADKDQPDPQARPPQDLPGSDGRSSDSLAVPCSNCLRRIACSAAINPEVGDAALYFCGRHCYREWLTTHEWKPIDARPRSARRARDRC